MNRIRLLSVVAVLAAGLTTGCGKKSPAPQNANGNAATNSSQNPAGAAGVSSAPAPVGPSGANSSAPTSEPQPSPNQPTPNQPSATGPAPIERVAPVVRTAPAGTAVTIRTTEEISSQGDNVGQRFTGVLERPIVSHGTVVFERGTPVAGQVLAEKNKGTFKGAGDLTVTLTAIGREPVKTSEFTAVAKGRGKRTGAFIGGGGGLGALIGGIAGGGKGALIGAAAGAGAGTVGSTTGSKDVVIKPETVITFRLRAPVSH